MKKLTIIYTVSFWTVLVSFLSCEEQLHKLSFDVLDSLIYTNPKEALKKIDSLSIWTNFMSEEQWMQYQLLRIKAKLRNCQSISRDTVIEEVADYYNNGNDNMRMNAQYLLGNYYAQRRDTPKALSCIFNAAHYTDTVKNARFLMLINGKMQKLYDQMLYYNYLELYHKMGTADSLYEYTKQYDEFKGSMLKNLNMERVAQIKSMYDNSWQQEAFLGEQRKNDRLHFYIFLILIIGVVVLIGMWRIVRRMKKQDREAARLQSDKYDLLMEEYRIMSEQYGMLKLEDAEMSRVNRELQKAIDGLQQELAEKDLAKTDDCVRLQQDARVANLRALAKMAKHPSAEEWESLHKALQEQDADFATWLSGHGSNFNEKELHLCMLVRLCFSPTEMAILLVTSKQNVSNMRSRLLKKLFNKEGVAVDFDACIRKMKG